MVYIHQLYIVSGKTKKRLSLLRWDDYPVSYTMHFVDGPKGILFLSFYFMNNCSIFDYFTNLLNQSDRSICEAFGLVVTDLIHY